VRRLTAVQTIAALLMGFFYAPFFHRHDAGDDHGIQTPIVHAHFFDREDIRRTHGFDSKHDKAHSVDLISTTETPKVQFDPFVLSAVVESGDLDGSFHVARIFAAWILQDDWQFRPPPLLRTHFLRAPPLRPSFAA
jgi:hypothetical protein